MFQLREIKCSELRHPQSTDVTHKPTRCPGSSAELLGPKAETVSAPTVSPQVLTSADFYTDYIA